MCSRGNAFTGSPSNYRARVTAALLILSEIRLCPQKGIVRDPIRASCSTRPFPMHINGPCANVFGC